MKSVEIRSFFWFIFSCIWTEYEDLLRNTKFTIWTLFAQCFCITIYSFVYQYPLHYYWYCYNQKQSSGAILQKIYSFKFCKIHKEAPKKRFRHRCFLVNSAKFPIASFLKNASDGFFIINTRYVHCPTSIQKQCHTYFLAEYFFGLICRLEARVSSILKALSQTSIFNLVEHVRFSFFGAIIVYSLKPLSIFAKNLDCDVRPGSKYASVSSQ